MPFVGEIKQEGACTFPVLDFLKASCLKSYYNSFPFLAKFLTASEGKALTLVFLEQVYVHSEIEPPHECSLLHYQQHISGTYHPEPIAYLQDSLGVRSVYLG